MADRDRLLARLEADLEAALAQVREERSASGSVSINDAIRAAGRQRTRPGDARAAQIAARLFGTHEEGDSE